MLPEAADFKRNWQAAQKARLAEGVEADSYVYVHLNADDGIPHHVGIGYTIDRPWEMTASRNKKHKNKVNKHGVRVEILASDLTLEQACFWEVRWIAALRAAGYELTNLTDGGEGTKGFKPSEETRAKMRGPRPIISKQKQGHWTGELNPNKKIENKTKISKRMVDNNPMQNPEVVVTRSGENHHSKKEGWISPNLGKPNLAAKERMLTDNPMKVSDIARKANNKRKENGNGWEGDKNPSAKMTKEQLLARGQKSAETRRLKGKSDAIFYMAWHYQNVRPQFYWGA